MTKNRPGPTQGVRPIELSVKRQFTVTFYAGKVGHDVRISFFICYFFAHGSRKGLAGLQITVGHRKMADQNLPMSDEITTLVGHFV